MRIYFLVRALNFPVWEKSYLIHLNWLRNILKEVMKF